MTSTPIIDIEEEEFIKYQLEQQKQDQHDLKLFHELKQQEQQNKEVSIDDHILRIKTIFLSFLLHIFIFTLFIVIVLFTTAS